MEAQRAGQDGFTPFRLLQVAKLPATPDDSSSRATQANSNSSSNRNSNSNKRQQEQAQTDRQTSPDYYCIDTKTDQVES